VALLNPGQRANDAQTELDALEGARLRSSSSHSFAPARRTTIEHPQKNYASDSEDERRQMIDGLRRCRVWLGDGGNRVVTVRTRIAQCRCEEYPDQQNK